LQEILKILQDIDSCNKKGPFLARILQDYAGFLQDLAKFSGRSVLPDLTKF